MCRGSPCQVVSNPILDRVFGMAPGGPLKNPIHDNAFASLAALEVFVVSDLSVTSGGLCSVRSVVPVPPRRRGGARCACTGKANFLELYVCYTTVEGLICLRICSDSGLYGCYTYEEPFNRDQLQHAAMLAVQRS